MDKKQINTMVLGLFLGTAIGISAFSLLTKLKKSPPPKEEIYEKYYKSLNRWLLIKSRGQSLVDYFDRYDYKKIAVYGIGTIGQRLYDELKNSNIEIKYIIDNNKELKKSNMNIISKHEIISQEEVDLIVVTPFYDFFIIKNELEKIIDVEIQSIEEIIYNLSIN